MKNFEVFLSYKQSGHDGKLTPDVKIATELYKRLTDAGIKVFYSRETIEAIGESEYKDVIDHALDQAYILVAIGTSKENLNSKWVKYEWDSFIVDILSGFKDGQVISLIEGFSVNDLPRPLRQRQCFDNGMGDISRISSFILNSLRRVENSNKDLMKLEEPTKISNHIEKKENIGNKIKKWDIISFSIDEHICIAEIVEHENEVYVLASELTADKENATDKYMIMRYYEKDGVFKRIIDIDTLNKLRKAIKYKMGTRFFNYKKGIDEYIESCRIVK